MKLKYFLRGLASGIVITTVMLTISFRTREVKIPEHELIKRAQELGMVMQEERDLLSDTAMPAKEAEITETPTDTPEQSKEESIVTSQPTQQAEVTKEPESEATPTPSGEEAATPTAALAKEPTKEPTSAAEEKKVLTIVSGMWSDKVAGELQAMGVVENAAEFDQYLIKNGYADKIVVGTFEIPVGAPYEEIAHIITTR